jgi:hypothetical protein
VNRRFVKLFESAYGRYTNGGILVGDVVAFKPKAINHPDFESNDELKIKIKSLIDSGYNLRVVNIKNNFPVGMGGNNDNNINRRMALADIAQEIAPGRYYNYVTVPLDVLVVVSGIRPLKDQNPDHFNEVQPDINLPEVRDKIKRDSRINIKPVSPEKVSEDEEFSTGRQTRTSDMGNKKDSSGDRSLNNSNTVIPSSPNVTHKDPANYTADYLPKK